MIVYMYYLKILLGQVYCYVSKLGLELFNSEMAIRLNLDKFKARQDIIMQMTCGNWQFEEIIARAKVICQRKLSDNRFNINSN